MADDRYNWLDKDAAERLLRGEPVGARHGDGARELEQLLQAAAAVGGTPPGNSALPGEEAALAAFRQAAHQGAGARSAGRATGRAQQAVRAERTRVARPLRRGFAVALAACAIGGVAVAAGTGVLPTPFRGGDPEPASSVSAAESPGAIDTPEPGAQTDGTTAQTPDATPGGESGEPTDSPAPGSSPGATRGPGTPGGQGNTGGNGKGRGGDKGGHDTKKDLLLSLCQSYASGKRDGMDHDALRRLESRAGGADKVLAFCRAYLAHAATGGGSGDNDGFGGGLGGSGDSGGSGGDKEDGQPSSSSGAPSGSGPSPSAPQSSVNPADPGNAAPGATATSKV
ncbi:hypothetical protein [Streptomyces sp. NPDC020742]|uniref:hypothetical protein n=1 Tax=unclassified Streptomyces TaxID=2593676 RepID=UPI0033C8793E